MGTEDMQSLMKTVIAGIILVSLHTEVRTQPKSDDLHLHLHLDEMGEGETIKERGNGTLESSKLKRGSKKGGDYSMDDQKPTLVTNDCDECPLDKKLYNRPNTYCCSDCGEHGGKISWKDGLFCDDPECNYECTTFDTIGKDRKEKCSFPFKYRGVEYDYCPQCTFGCPRDRHWCSTTYEYEEKWLFCNLNNCPTEKPGSTPKTDPPVTPTSSPEGECLINNECRDVTWRPALINGVRYCCPEPCGSCRIVQSNGVTKCTCSTYSPISLVEEAGALTGSLESSCGTSDECENAGGPITYINGVRYCCANLCEDCNVNMVGGVVECACGSTKPIRIPPVKPTGLLGEMEERGRKKDKKKNKKKKNKKKKNKKKKVKECPEFHKDGEKCADSDEDRKKVCTCPGFCKKLCGKKVCRCDIAWCGCCDEERPKVFNGTNC